jgi:anaerobic dimethyl sulfoxide reductase subunit B (iron-sulfur subunit)
MTQYAFFFDQSRCYNGHACSVACRDWNDIQPGPVKWLRMLQWEKGVFPTMRMHVLFATCYHCEKPVCVDACVNKAIFKEGKYGAVLIDADSCTGSHDCWQACPYGAIQYASDELRAKASKCDMCYDRLEAGEQPICVMSCPARALDFGPIERMKILYGELSQLDDMPEASETNPAVVFKPMNKRKIVVPYDVNRSLELLVVRDGLPPVFESGINNLEQGLIGYKKLVMKPENVTQGLALSKNEEG